MDKEENKKCVRRDGLSLERKMVRFWKSYDGLESEMAI